MEFRFHFPQACFALRKVGPNISERARSCLALFKSFDSVAEAVGSWILSRLSAMGVLLAGIRLSIAFHFLPVRGLKRNQVGG